MDNNKKELSLKEKLQIYIKNQPKLSSKKLIAIILCLIIVIVGVNFLPNSKSIGVDATGKGMDDRLVKGTMVGDVMLGRAITNRASKDNYSSVLNSVSGLWKDSDYVFGNLECTLIDKADADKVEKDHTRDYYNAETKSVKVLKENGFTVLGLANNHVGDFGDVGINSTLATLDEAKIDHVGAGKNITDASKINLKEVNGVKIATIAISDVYSVDDSASAQKAGILSTVNSTYYQSVRDAASSADLVIVSMHWGESSSLTTTKQQQQLARNLINFGADIVVGSNPNVVQPIEKYNNGIIFYSLGNFVFDQGWSRNKDSMVLNYYIDKEGNCSFEVVPVRIKEGYPTFTKNPLFKSRIFKSLTKDLTSKDFTEQSNLLLLKNAIKIEVKEKEPEQPQQTTTDQGTGYYNGTDQTSGYGTTTQDYNSYGDTTTQDYNSQDYNSYGDTTTQDYNSQDYNSYEDTTTQDYNSYE